MFKTITQQQHRAPELKKTLKEKGQGFHLKINSWESMVSNISPKNQENVMTLTWPWNSRFSDLIRKKIKIPAFSAILGRFWVGIENLITSKRFNPLPSKKSTI